MILLKGTLDLESVSLGRYLLHDVEFWECQRCGNRILPNATWIAADREHERLLKERISSLPAGDFLSAAEAAQLLGITRQALHKHRKISKGFVHSITIGGKKHYHKRSVVLFMQTGDGRFPIGESKQKDSPYVVVYIQVPAPEWQSSVTISPLVGVPYYENAIGPSREQAASGLYSHSRR